MKRLYFFLCLLLSLCILLPAFSISLYAQEVDGNQVYTYWYIDNPEDSILFENTIVNYSQPLSHVVTSTIILSDPIPKNNLFDFELGLSFDSCTFTDIQVTFLDSGSKKIDTLAATVTDNVLSLSSLQFDSEVSKIIITFNISYASWKVVSTIYDVSIDGSVYNFEKNMTWSSWCSSSYNTLGLYVEDGFVYKSSGYILSANGESVSSSALISSNISYYIQSLEPAVTIINFTVDGVSYQAESGMTWSSWINSDYNTLGLYSSDGQVYGTIENQTLYFQNTAIKDTDEIIHNRSYITRIVVPIYTFYVIHESSETIEEIFEFEKGMTWEQWLSSDYNVNEYYVQYNYVYSDYGQRIYRALGNNNKESVYISDDIYKGGVYGNKSYCDLTVTLPYVSREYQFDFYITSVSTTIINDNGLLNGIIAWLKKTVSSITSLPGKIVSEIGNKLELWFVPNEDRIVAIKEEFELELKGRFGVLFDAVDIVDMVANTFVYRSTDSTVTLPSVTVDLAGTPFTFGGYEVEVIPDGFEDLVETLRLVVNIICTWYFVLAMKKRLEEVLQ